MRLSTQPEHAARMSLAGNRVLECCMRVLCSVSDASSRRPRRKRLCCRVCRGSFGCPEKRCLHGLRRCFWAYFTDLQCVYAPNLAASRDGFDPVPAAVRLFRLGCFLTLFFSIQNVWLTLTRLWFVRSFLPTSFRCCNTTSGQTFLRLCSHLLCSCPSLDLRSAVSAVRDVLASVRYHQQGWVRLLASMKTTGIGLHL